MGFDHYRYEDREGDQDYTSLDLVDKIQAEQRVWALRNFGPETYSYHVDGLKCLLGVGEEVGELMHAHLKHEQGIRGDPSEHINAAQDAVGDICIYLMDYCNRRGWDFGQLIDRAWSQVRDRDWKANKQDGGGSS
jgi:NTP pyrophosphatase (non-canonical NTP hydrolase)